MTDAVDERPAAESLRKTKLGRNVAAVLLELRGVELVRMAVDDRGPPLGDRTERALQQLRRRHAEVAAADDRHAHLAPVPDGNRHLEQVRAGREVYVVRPHRPLRDAVPPRPHREDRRVDREADVTEHVERPEILGSDRKVLCAEGRDRRSGSVLDGVMRALELVAELAPVHRVQRPVAVAVRLDLVTLRHQLLQELRERLCDASLDEERPFDPEVVEDGENSIDVADDAVRDRRVVVDARLIPVLHVDRERGDRNSALGRVDNGCRLDHDSSESTGLRPRRRTRGRVYVISPTTGSRVTRRRWSTSSSSAFLRTSGDTSASAAALRPSDVPSARPNDLIRTRVPPPRERGTLSTSADAAPVVRARPPASASTAANSGWASETSTPAAYSSSSAASASRSMSGPAAINPMLRTFSVSAARHSRRAIRVIAARRAASPSGGTAPRSGVSKTRASASLPTNVGRSVSSRPAAPTPRIRPRSAPRTSSCVWREASARNGLVAELITAGFGRNAADEMIAIRSDSRTPRCCARKSRNRDCSSRFARRLFAVDGEPDVATATFSESICWSATEILWLSPSIRDSRSLMTDWRSPSATSWRTVRTRFASALAIVDASDAFLSLTDSCMTPEVRSDFPVMWCFVRSTGSRLVTRTAVSASRTCVGLVAIAVAASASATASVRDFGSSVPRTKRVVAVYVEGLCEWIAATPRPSATNHAMSGQCGRKIRRRASFNAMEPARPSRSVARERRVAADSMCRIEGWPSSSFSHPHRATRRSRPPHSCKPCVLADIRQWAE